ncbi:MAG: DegV family protein [Brevefilum sp.]|nr:DegV family protein [Brevefilum sp.]MDW7754323.1 DegV family protein [Brevefilum sp.]
MINILTDSIADIPKDLLAKYFIKAIPMYVQLNGSVYSDGETITPDEIFKNVEKTGKYPTTSAPPPSDFLEYFDCNEPSIFIGVSGQLSATIKNALAGKQELGKKDIEIIDSRSISIGYGNVVLQAAKWRDEDFAFDELVQKIRDLVTASRGIFILNSLEYLYHGGRCSAIDHFASSLLKIRPFLNIKPDGTLGVLKKVRGSRNKAVKELFNYFTDQYLNYEIDHISIGHLDCIEEAELLKDKINALGYKKEILITKIGCVLASHSGPYPLGIAFSAAEK